MENGRGLCTQEMGDWGVCVQGWVLQAYQLINKAYGGI